MTITPIIAVTQQTSNKRVLLAMPKGKNEIN